MTIGVAFAFSIRNLTASSPIRQSRVCPTEPKSFTVDELSALIFRLDIAETVEQLDEVSARLRDEIVKELESRKDDC
jgi:hypothetical protein